MNWQETDWRSYDEQLGRFHQVEPLADFFVGISPYQFGYNNPIMLNDPSGLDPGFWDTLIGALVANNQEVTFSGEQVAALYDDYKSDMSSRRTITTIIESGPVMSSVPDRSGRRSRFERRLNRFINGKSENINSPAPSVGDLFNMGSGYTSPSPVPLTFGGVGSVITGGFKRSDDFYNTTGQRWHLAADLASPRGSPIYATHDGVLKNTGLAGGYVVEHKIGKDGGVRTLYGHIKVRQELLDKKVKEGNIIGYMDNVGTHGIHLHYEIQYKGPPRNGALNHSVNRGGAFLFRFWSGEGKWSSINPLMGESLWQIGNNYPDLAENIRNLKDPKVLIRLLKLVQRHITKGRNVKRLSRKINRFIDSNDPTKKQKNKKQ